MAKEQLKQVNVRISQEAYEILEAVAYLRGVQPPAVLRPIIEQHLRKEQSANRRVGVVRRQRAEERAEASGRLAPLLQRKQSRGRARFRGV